MRRLPAREKAGLLRGNEEALVKRGRGAGQAQAAALCQIFTRASCSQLRPCGCGAVLTGVEACEFGLF